MANGNITPEEIRAILSGGNPRDMFSQSRGTMGTISPEEQKAIFSNNQPNAHENIDTLINQDDNKDYYELMKKISNFIPPTGILNLLQLANRPQEESLAAWEAFRKPEEDPMTPPRAAGPPVPFSEYIQDRNQYMPWLDKGLGNKQDVISILQKYTDELTKKK
jgi:hypothetical protein